MQKLYLIERLKKSEFLSNISIQFIGTVIAQSIPVLISPLLARIYPESGFATMAIFMAIVGVLNVPNGGRYYLAIVLPKLDRDSKNLTLLSIYFSLIYAIVLVILIYIFYTSINRFYVINGGWYLIPIYILFFGIYNSFLYLSVRKKQFKTNARAKIAQTFTNSAISIVLGFTGFLNLGLVFGKMVGVVMGIPILIKERKFEWFKFKKLRNLAMEYIDYPKITIIPAILDIFSLQALVLFVGKFYSELDLGYLALTNMLIIAPLVLIGSSFKDVFFQRNVILFQQKDYKKARNLFLTSALFLFIAGFMITLILFLFGEVLFTIIYGSKWKMSGIFASILTFSIWVKLIVSPLSTIFNVVNKLRIAAYWQILYFTTTITTLYICIEFYQFSIINLLVVYTVHEIILYGLYFMLQLNVLKNFQKTIL